MKYILKIFSFASLMLSVLHSGFAYINSQEGQRQQQKQQVEYRNNCDAAVAQIDQAINNVRARLLTGGDVWWNSRDGRYVVPKVPAGQPEVSSIFAGAVWLGGVDPAGNLKVAAQTYGRSSGRADFWPGPLDPITGTVEKTTCAQWDRFFRVTGEEIDEHLRNYEASIKEGKPYDSRTIPRNVRGWPARGNQFFFDIHRFELPNTSQGLAGFWDRDGDGLYEPDEGDYPIIEIRGCPEPQYPDEMIFWIYNDAGNIHSESRGDPIQMEVQVQAFSYATNDQINDMTFQRYKLINRAIESIDSMFFAMWVDPDLGCYTDDYVGCDTLRSLGFVYNSDAVDGSTGCNCEQGVNTYCEEVPILGVDYFRGPLNENFEEIGMSSFTYYNNRGIGGAPPGTTDPNNAQEYYNYLSGSWRDGSPFTFGDDAYQDGAPVKYAFPGNPARSNEWSMCSQRTDPNLDRRTIQASGPFRLDPGAVNELIIGVVWVPKQLYPCPDIKALQFADDIAQALFDNCFELTDGPDAPDLDFIELDREIIVVMTNDTIQSNNAFEGYAQRGLQIPEFADDTLYLFEGYKVYQLAGPDVTLGDLENPDRARLVYQADLKNNISRIFNWVEQESPLEETFYAPTLKVNGANQGIKNTFRITEDQFAEGDRRIVNHKKYYFTAVAYAHNNYEEYDPKTGVGQRDAYLEGRRNIGDGTNPFYTAIPRPLVYQELNAQYGDGAVITRIDGIGAGGNFLDMSDETRDRILNGSFNGEIVYKAGAGPIDISIFNPLKVKNGRFTLTFVDSDLSNQVLDPGARWKLIDNERNIELFSEKTIAELNDQILPEYGFSIAIGQTPDVGQTRDRTNGAIGGDAIYQDLTKPLWFNAIPDDADQFTNFVATGFGEPDEVLDPRQALSRIGNRWFVPYTLTDWRARVDQTGIGYFSPAWSQSVGGNGGTLVRNSNPLSELNNVDIVFTADKSKWSRCVVVETFDNFDAQLIPGVPTQGNSRFFDLRNAPSVSREDANGDGLPDPDASGTIGMGWFPGYAIDVETGQRLNIFFGENSIYGGDVINFSGFQINATGFTGRDMMWNPTNQFNIPVTETGNNFFRINGILGGRHYIYVTRQIYDECEVLRQRLAPGQPALRKVNVLKDITWTSMPVLAQGQSLLSYAQGLIPNDLTIKLRVDNPYQVVKGTGAFNGYPTYQFKLEGVEATALNAQAVESPLNDINVVPNPYYGYSAYENSQFSNIVKITNLPAKCIVKIYTLDGKFIREYNRNELGALPGPRSNNRAIERNQISPALEWDLKNSKGIPVASGVYLIHVDAGELGQKVIKWFGVARQFDPSGL